MGRHDCSVSTLTSSPAQTGHLKDKRKEEKGMKSTIFLISVGSRYEVIVRSCLWAQRLNSRTDRIVRSRWVHSVHRT